MLGFDPKAARYTWTVAAVLMLLWLVYQVRSTLFIFVLALLFAYLLTPLVELLNRALPFRARTPALALAYVIFVAVTVFVVIQIGATVALQARALQQDLPKRIAQFEAPSPKLPAAVNNFKAQLIERIRLQLSDGASEMVGTVAQAGYKALSVAGDLIFVVVIPILAFFFLKEGPTIRDNILALVENDSRRALLDDILADVHLLLAHYMRAMVVLAAATFVAYGVFFALVGMPYGVLLAVVASVLEFIPMVGPLSSGVVIMLVAALSHSHPLAVLIFLLVYRLFQDYVLQPYLLGQGVEVHPLLVIFGVFAGGEIAGIPGTLLSVPAIALVRILARNFRKARAAAKLVPIVPTRV